MMSDLLFLACMSFPFLLLFCFFVKNAGCSSLMIVRQIYEHKHMFSSKELKENEHNYSRFLKCICHWLLRMTAGTCEKLKCFSFASLKAAVI